MFTEACTGRQTPRLFTACRSAILVVAFLFAPPVLGQWASGTSNAIYYNGGNVGVGTSSPFYKFAVHAGGGLVGFYSPIPGSAAVTFHNDSNSNWVEGRIYGSPLSFFTSGQQRFLIDTLGNVGIGTASPTSQFHLFSNAGGGPTNGLRIGNASIGTIYGLHAGALAPDAAFLTFGDGSGWKFHIGKHSDSGATRFMTVQDNGNVGIGTSLPAQRLHVEGNIHVSGNINAKYQDVAEWVDTIGDLSPGTVVVLDPEHPNTVRASSAPHAESVAGVVSAQPGLILGEPGKGRKLIATTGRVRVRVSAAPAPVRIGDLLVTGPLPGTAMRSEPRVVDGERLHRVGTILGKALEPLPSGTGEILVLLSLQ